MPISKYIIRKWANYMNKHFTKEDKQMVNRHRKRCLTSLTIKQMQIKTTMRCRCIPLIMTKIKNRNTTKCWERCGKTGSLIHCWWACKMIPPLWKIVSCKTKQAITTEQSNSTLGLRGGKKKMYVCQKKKKLYTNNSLVCNTQTMDISDVLQQMKDKLQCRHTMEHYT